MALHDWIDKYPRVQRLLQAPGDVLDYTPDLEAFDIPDCVERRGALYFYRYPGDTLEILPLCHRDVPDRCVAILAQGRCLTPVRWTLADERSEARIAALALQLCAPAHLFLYLYTPDDRAHHLDTYCGRPIGEASRAWLTGPLETVMAPFCDMLDLRLR